MNKTALSYANTGLSREYLVERGADVMMTDNDGRTALHVSMEAHSATAPVIEALMSRSFDIERKDAEGMTLLAYAAFYGHSEMISHLLAKNAKVDAETNLGFQPLHLAAQYGYIQAIQVLVEAGADINAKTHRGDTAVLIAARRDYQDVVYFLGKNGADLIAVGEYSYNALHHATKNDNKLLLDFLVSQEVPVDVKAVFGWTPLMTAARHANSETTLFLIEHGADVNTTDDNGWRPLHVAALRGHRVIVEKLLENGADPFAETKDGHRAEFICRQAEDPSFQRYLAPQEKSWRSDLDSERILHVLQEKTAASLNAQPEEKRKSIAILVACAGRGQVDRVAKLLDEGCDVNGRDFNGRTATSMAAENGKDSILQLLIQRGADVNLPDADSELPLWWAARYGHRQAVTRLLGEGARVEAPDDNGQSPLSVASQQGHIYIAKTLLQKGANPNSLTIYGKTPLHFAAASGRLHMARVLLQSGAEPNCKTKDGSSSWELALNNGHRVVSRWLLSRSIILRLQQRKALPHQLKREYMNAPRPIKQMEHPKSLLREWLSDAAAIGRATELGRLIGLGIDINEISNDSKRETPTIRAAKSGQVRAVQLLVKHNADIFVKDSKGRTALAHAAHSGHANVVRVLHDCGANIDEMDNESGSPLMVAARKGHEDLPAVLLRLGARTELKNDKRATALWFAAFHGHEKLAELLLGHGANKEAADAGGCTPLLAAIQNRQRHIAALLLRNSAVTRPDSMRNYSPLFVAVENRDAAMVNLLVEHDADLNHLADALRTPLHIAASSGDTVVVEALLLAGSRTDIKDDDGRTAVSYAKEYSHEPVVKLFSSARYLHREIPGNLQHSGRNIKHFKPSYEYQRLKRETFIRILRLHPGKSDDVLSFDLTEADLDRKPSFEALSYEWRGKVGSIPVLCNNQQLLITPNCKAAMQTLRRESTFRNLWIDALCINQEDYSEKAKQVALMTRIYGIAEKVLMWLGSGCLNTNAAFDEMAEMADLSRSLRHDEQGAMAMERASGILRKTNVLAGFRELEESQYFTRAWIFQEVVLGQSRGLIMCGKCQCSWEVFQYAMETFQEHEVEHRRSTRPWPRQIAGCIANFEQNGRLSLPEALDMMSYLSAGDPRDKIFAALGVTKLEDQRMGVSTPFPDYQVFDWAVFVDTTRYLIHDSGSMHFWYLGCRRGLKSMAKLPSWVPEFKRYDKAPLWSAHGIRTVTFASILRGQPSTRLSPDMSSLNELLASSRPSTTFSSLYVTACFVDKVVFCLEDDSDDDVYSLVLSAAKELARRGRSIYDPYTGLNAEDAPNEGRSQTARLPVGGCDFEMTHLDALLVTILAVEDEDVRKLWDIWTYIAWMLSRDHETPIQSRTPPWPIRGGHEILD